MSRVALTLALLAVVPLIACGFRNPTFCTDGDVQVFGNGADRTDCEAASSR